MDRNQRPPNSVINHFSFFLTKMVLYELLMITRCQAKAAGKFNYGVYSVDKPLIRKLLDQCTRQILNNNGVVRKFENLGSKQLPYRMKRHQEIFDSGSYFTITFDSSPKVMEELCANLKLNEAVIRHSILKLGDRLCTVSEYVPPHRLPKESLNNPI